MHYLMVTIIGTLVPSSQKQTLEAFDLNSQKQTFDGLGSKLNELRFD